ncbi:hypothetical protein GN244_ATG00494 [Phytophthora infestans]|uniref:Ion transport domain-containing protein n=1 Tax=Phytophthora infestans TaxID=4787 RepID=A0A833WQJ6_PHYIN|nr:hypothetical protein GN244_ATG00494 [Phytophthora infestans]
MRLCRLLRIFELAHNHTGTYILLRAIRASVAPISVTLIFFTEIVLFFSVVMYMWSLWPPSDGDITPTKGNVASRCFAVMIIMSGTLFLSMPLAIIGTELDRATQKESRSSNNFKQGAVARDYNVVAAFADETIAVWSVNC